MADKRVSWSILSSLTSQLWSKCKSYSRVIEVNCSGFPMPYSGQVPDAAIVHLFGMSITNLVSKIKSGEVLSANMRKVTISSQEYDYLNIPVRMELSGPNRDYYKIMIVYQGYVNLRISFNEGYQYMSLSFTR